MSSRTNALRIASTIIVGAACATSSACSSSSSGAGKNANGDYDVIVVGSGAGGGPLAARLARGGKRVLLLEAGEDVGASLSYEVPARHALATEDATRAWSFYVQHHRDASVDAQDSKYVAKERGILYPRGSALGGSTAVNAMVTVLPSPSDWNRLAELSADASFRDVSMQKYYGRVQEWLSTELADTSLAIGDPIVSGFLFAGARMSGDNDVAKATSVAELFGPDVNASLSSGETTGFFRLPYATASGHRRGSRERILDTVIAGFPLTVSTSSFVTHVNFDTSVSPPRAIGVEYRKGVSLYSASANYSSDTQFDTATASAGEIVLSAGTFNTPQILMLSGVGDRDTLGGLGIDVVDALPGVGRNLQDRYEAGVVAEFDQPIPILADCTLGNDDNDPCLNDWRAGRGVYNTPGFLASALVRSTPETPLADLQIFAVPADARGYYPGYSAFSAAQKNRFSWLILKAHAQNKSGFVVPVSSEPSQRPHIQMNTFDGADVTNPSSDPDLAAMVQAVKMVRSIHTSFRQSNPDHPFTEIWPGAAVSTDAQIADFINKETWGHHACCTDKMGTADDPGAVVDSHFRVFGTQHLRVVDASVFPEIPGTFIALPLYMLSEKAADVMLEDLP